MGREKGRLASAITRRDPIGAGRVLPTRVAVGQVDQSAPEERPADRIEPMNGAEGDRPAVFIKLDLIVARLKAVNETAVGIVKHHLLASIWISLQNDLAGAGVVDAHWHRLLSDLRPG